MSRILFENGDGEQILLSEVESHVVGVLRWLCSRGAPEVKAVCEPLVETVRVSSIEQARAGTRQRGEPVVVLKSGDNCAFSPGDEVTLDEIDSLFRFKYHAAALAIQRARKARTVVAILFKERETAPQVDSAGNIYEEDREPSKEFRFCRVSDIAVVAEQYPAAVERHQKKLDDAAEDKFRMSLSVEARRAFDDKRLATHRAKLEAERAGREAKEEAQAAVEKAIEDTEAAERARLEEEAELAAVAERLAKKREEKI